MLYFKKYSDAPNFRDYRNNVDDKTVLVNPDKGWYLHFVDNGMRRGIYRDDIEEGNFLKEVPGLKQLYLRIDWSDIEKEEGVFDWSEIDRIMDEWGAHGYTFSFRFCTYEGNNHSIPYATPKWVFDKGAKYIKVIFDYEHQSQYFPVTDPDSYEPIYDDEIFLHYVDLFLAECSRKFNGNPLVDYIDIGTFGTWGEGHTSTGSDSVYPFSVLDKHVDLHVKHFPDTQLFLLWGFLYCPIMNQVPGYEPYLEKWLSLGIGLRSDSVNVASFSKEYAYDSLGAPDLFELFAKESPINIENAHQRLCPPEAFRDGLSFIEALKNSQATFAGFHGYITEWWPKYKYLHEYLANRLGYWYFLQGVDLPETITEAEAKSLPITLYVENKGYAHAYHKYQPKFLAVSVSDGKSYEVSCTDFDNRLWQSNEKVQVKTTLSFKDVPAGAYHLYFGLQKGNRPILFAYDSAKQKEGLLDLGEFSIH